ncbi:hypothetical protein EBU95_15225 [bacterium]|nr:hypothetical protein [bacterium]
MFLEDAVELQHRYPNFPAYRHPVFLMPEWARYASRERVDTNARRQAYTSSAADVTAQIEQLRDEQRQLAGAHTAALQGLVSKLTDNGSGSGSGGVGQDVSGNGGNSAGSNEGTVDGSAPVHILPPTIGDITQFYWEWCTGIRAQYRARKRIEWKHLDKHTARLASQRWSQLSVMLDFLDGVGADGSEPSEAALAALEIMVSFADTMGISHTVLAKKVVVEMIRGVEIGPVYKGMGDKLRAKLESSGFTVPRKPKQDHSYKYTH